jgi:hypothetical protein
MNSSNKSLIRDYRSRLNLTTPPFDEIDDEYFAVIVSNPSKLDKQTYNFLVDVGLMTSTGSFFEQLEWLGDSILETSIRRYLFRAYKKAYTLGNLHNIKVYIVQNATLYCLSVMKNICIDTTKWKQVKKCADRLESIIGLLFYYFDIIKNDCCALNIVSDWILTTFKIPELIDKFIRGERIRCATSPSKIATKAQEYSSDDESDDEILELPPGPPGFHMEPAYESEEEELEIPMPIPSTTTSPASPRTARRTTAVSREKMSVNEPTLSTTCVYPYNPRDRNVSLSIANPVLKTRFLNWITANGFTYASKIKSLRGNYTIGIYLQNKNTGAYGQLICGTGGNEKELLDNLLKQFIDSEYYHKVAK